MDHTLECPMCFEDVHNLHMMATKCGHMFCSPCLKDHNPEEIHFKCPICRIPNFRYELLTVFLPMSESYHTVQQLTQRVETLQAALAESHENESRAITKFTEAQEKIDLLQIVNTSAKESEKELCNELHHVVEKLCKLEATIREKEAAIGVLGVENVRLARAVNGIVAETEIMSEEDEDKNELLVSGPDHRSQSTFPLPLQPGILSALPSPTSFEKDSLPVKTRVQNTRTLPTIDGIMTRAKSAMRQQELFKDPAGPRKTYVPRCNLGGGMKHNWSNVGSNIMQEKWTCKACRIIVQEWRFGSKVSVHGF